MTITLALMLNELATNATKYGALSGTAGKVVIAWTASPTAESLAVALTWREEGGPPVAPPQRRGFGSRLLVASAEQIRGELAVDFAPAGVIVRLGFAVPRPTPETSWAARAG